MAAFSRVYPGVLTLAFALLLASPLSAQTAASQAPHVGPVRPGLYMNRFIPPPMYEQWYHDAERCLGRQGDYERVEWLMVQAPWLEGQHKTLGSWEEMSNGVNRIVVNARDWTDSTLVMHEAMHDILWRSGWRKPALPPNATDADSLRAAHPTPPFDVCAPAFFSGR